ncbi:MAG TPA: hypothetical protein VFX16_30795 [Pseudonocardiaceae bacterium]|nr:hypothetical protein [Pseudonocardiaceae bacterium]
MSSVIMSISAAHERIGQHLRVRDGNRGTRGAAARARPDTRGAWYRDWLLTAVDGITFTVPDADENDRGFGRPGSGRAAGKPAYPQLQAACLVEWGRLRSSMPGWIAMLLRKRC